MRFQRLATTLIFAFRRLHDPQVQVWVMAGFAVLLVLIGHLRAWSPSGEGKNSATASPSRLLLAGARLSWTEEFGPAQRASHRPAVVLTGPVTLVSTPSRRPAVPAFDGRAAMQDAAGRPWKFLSLPLRQHLGSAAKPAAALKIHLAWSGDSRGNAALVARRNFLATSPPDSSFSSSSSAAAFVIGNGSRSGDGRIEMIAPHASLAEGQVSITLVGDGTGPTPRQALALGELLNHLEALTGFSVLLPMDGTEEISDSARLAGI